jgi:hypothetical protein
VFRLVKAIVSSAACLPVCGPDEGNRWPEAHLRRGVSVRGARITHEPEHAAFALSSLREARGPAWLEGWE